MVFRRRGNVKPSTRIPAASVAVRTRVTLSRESNPMRETSTARIALGDDGILVVRIKKGARQRPADARENLNASAAAASGHRRPLLVDITGSPPLDAETRHLYSGEALNVGFTALALLVDGSPLG